MPSLQNKDQRRKQRKPIGQSSLRFLLCMTCTHTNQQPRRFQKRNSCTTSHLSPQCRYRWDSSSKSPFLNSPCMCQFHTESTNLVQSYSRKFRQGTACKMWHWTTRWYQQRKQYKTPTPPQRSIRRRKICTKKARGSSTFRHCTTSK